MGFTVASADLEPEARAEDINKRQVEWVDKSQFLAKAKAKGRAKKAGWRPTKLHRASARECARMMGNQLQVTTGRGLVRFRMDKKLAE